jgi:hypothetical protein
VIMRATDVTAVSLVLQIVQTRCAREEWSLEHTEDVSMTDHEVAFYSALPSRMATSLAACSRTVMASSTSKTRSVRRTRSAATSPA